VASLVVDSESGDSLVDDDGPIQPLQSPQVDDYTDPNWEPEPVDAGPDFRANKPSDVVSTLVSIYDSKDLFVKELQVLLAQRLLAVTDGNYEKEVCTLIRQDLIAYDANVDSVGIWRSSRFGLEKLRCRFAK
jgi:anaphase-promoting complex subunit 2